MANRKLERMGIDTHICERFTRSGITTVREFITTSPIVLMLIADLSMKEVKDLVAMVSERVSCKSQNALAIMLDRTKKKRVLSTGIGKLDSAMKGGLLLGSISEICGSPGAGKTQFCLSCTLQALCSPTVAATASSSTASSSSYLTSLNNANATASINSGPVEITYGVIYIDTELKFDPNRLVQLAIENFPHQFSGEFCTDAPHQIDRLLAAVQVLY